MTRTITLSEGDDLVVILKREKKQDRQILIHTTNIRKDTVVEQIYLPDLSPEKEQR